MKIDSIRKEYRLGGLSESDIDKDPLKQFTAWLKDAIGSENHEPTAMTLSTIGCNGFPQSRIVLLKSSDESGFSFFTSYLSAKASELETTPRAALHFFWPELQRQVRITGFVEKTGNLVSDNYFKSRPRNNQLGAWASHQSHEVASRDQLDKQFGHYLNYFSGKEIPRPDQWGGYKVNPIRFEFWQGRENRMHDRLVYEKAGNNWMIKRLSP